MKGALHRWILCLVVLAIAALGHRVEAQNMQSRQLQTQSIAPQTITMPRGKRTIVRGGLLQRADSLRVKADSVALERLYQDADSIFAAEFATDSLALREIRTDDLTTLDSIALAEMMLDGVQRDTTRKLFHKGWFMSDSMGLSRVSWMSAIVPGYGQIYNKQYWKLPILYGTLAGSLASVP